MSMQCKVDTNEEMFVYFSADIFLLDDPSNWMQICNQNRSTE